MTSSNQQRTWTEIPQGGVSWRQADETLTGDWRGEDKPNLDSDKCTRCLLCWVYCPDAAINFDQKDVTINYDYCKGCGICATECPVNAITMIKE